MFSFPAEITEILSVYSPGDCVLTPENYANYIKMVLGVFYCASRSLKELRYLCEIHLGHYCTPILNGVCGQNDLRALWKEFDPCLRAAMDTVFLRTVSSAKYIRDKGELLIEKLQIFVA